MGKVTSTEHKLTEIKYKCGHCGIDARMSILYEGEHTITGNDSSGGDVWFTDFYQLLLCPSCDSINVIKTSYDHETSPIDEEGNYDVVVEYLFPSIKSGNFKNLPSLVEKSYAEAIKLKKLAPTASVVFSRKSLEAICFDQNATGRVLKDKIDSLAQKGVIPTLLKDAAHSVRALGNEGAHDLDAEVSVDDAETLLALCNAIIGYVYEAPQLVQRIQERLKKIQR